MEGFSLFYFCCFKSLDGKYNGVFFIHSDRDRCCSCLVCSESQSIHPQFQSTLHTITMSHLQCNAWHSSSATFASIGHIQSLDLKPSHVNRSFYLQPWPMELPGTLRPHPTTAFFFFSILMNPIHSCDSCRVSDSSQAHLFGTVAWWVPRFKPSFFLTSLGNLHFCLIAAIFLLLWSIKSPQTYRPCYLAIEYTHPLTCRERTHRLKCIQKEICIPRYMFTYSP